MSSLTEDIKMTDLVEQIRSGGTHNFVPEQERNFDAGYSPSPHKWKFVKEEWIDGKRYMVYS